jgi:hypothetical protein
MEPLSGGAPVAKVVMFCDDHTEGLGVDAIGELKRTTLPLLESAAMSTADASKAMASVPATFGASVNVDTSRTDHELRPTPLALYTSRSPMFDVVTKVGTNPGMTIGSLATATFDGGSVVVVTGFVVVVTGFVVVVTGFVVVVTGFVVVVTGLVVVVTGFVVVVTGFVVVVTGLVVVVTGV